MSLNRPQPKTKAAQELIAESSYKELPALTEGAVDFLRDMLEYNDASGSNRGRQSESKVRAKLAKSFGVRVGTRVFGRLIQHHFKRGWGSK